MSFWKYKPINFKTIFLGALICLLIIFAILSILYYFKVYLPFQETKQLQKEFEESEVRRLEWYKQQREKELDSLF